MQRLMDAILTDAERFERNHAANEAWRVEIEERALLGAFAEALRRRP